MLEGDNYGVWAAKMKVFMRAQGVWTAIEGNPKIDGSSGTTTHRIRATQLLVYDFAGTSTTTETQGRDFLYPS
jgi:hypothetical protein